MGLLHCFTLLSTAFTEFCTLTACFNLVLQVLMWKLHLVLSELPLCWQGPEIYFRRHTHMPWTYTHNGGRVAGRKSFTDNPFNWELFSGIINVNSTFQLRGAWFPQIRQVRGNFSTMCLLHYGGWKEGRLGKYKYMKTLSKFPIQLLHCLHLSIFHCPWDFSSSLLS